MGKAARRKRELRTQPAPAGPTRWAGAPGMHRARLIADRYVSALDRIVAAQARGNLRDEADAQIQVAQLRIDIGDRQIATLEAALRALGEQPEPHRRKHPGRITIPDTRHETRAAFEADSFKPYAESLAALARDQLQAINEATPIVFDPLSVPEPTLDAVQGLGLPFPTVVCDFLTPTGMTLPVEVMENSSGWWVGLIAATISQGEEDGPVDVWPTVTTLEPERADDDQRHARELMFGRVRFGGPLPAPPTGLALHEFDGGTAWVMDDFQDGALWADLWIIKPALAAVSALRLLDAVNVDLTPISLDRAARRRAQRDGAVPALKVDITTGGHASAGGRDGAQSIEWQHRWTVRGHWKHFGEQTAVARRHPSRVMDVPGRGRCVKVWCPPHVKGPADKPLVLKTRVVAHPQPVK